MLSFSTYVLPNAKRTRSPLSACVRTPTTRVVGVTGRRAMHHIWQLCLRPVRQSSPGSLSGDVSSVGDRRAGVCHVRSRRLRAVTMRIAKSTVVLLTFVLMLSILVANVADFINVESHSSYETFRDNNGMTQTSDYKYPKYYDIGRSFDRLMWFLQISDLHLSIFKDVSRILELQEFCNVTVDSIRPVVVVASGDLTDAIASNRLGSKQLLPEWRSYKYIMEVTNIKEKTLWLDVRGNHDNFNIISLDSKYNYYSNYSIQGKEHPRSYMYNVNVGSETYSFIAIDACLKPGPKRPFNFIGVLDQHEIDKIKQLIKQSQESKVDHAIVFGHYPTSCIASQADTDIRSLLGSYRENMAYLCGHYHTFGGTMPNMYTLQKGGFLELELADWKDNRMYRLAAIDHGQFSFIDIKHNDWPVVLITNPKNAQSRMPQKENPKSVITSTHVRVLAFSTAPIRTVEIQFDKHGDWLQCDHVKGPLYVLPWTSTQYTKGIHHITARVIDTENREKIVSHDFSLDGSFLSFRVLPKLILMYSVSHIFQIAFFVALATIVVPLCLLRFIHMYRKRRRMYRPRIDNRFLHWMVRKLWVLSTVDKVFIALMLYTLNIAVGPWSVGEVIDGHIGAIFVWGIYVGNSYLPGGITYFYGYMHLLFFNLLLTIILAVQADRRLQEIEHPAGQRVSKFRSVCRSVPICLLLLLQVACTYTFYLEYGILAVLLSPLRTGSIFIAIVLYVYIETMPSSCLSSAAAMWYRREAVNGAVPGAI